jgi:acetolactate synthase-1/3 small subunit
MGENPQESMEEPMKHTLVAAVRNRPDVLDRTAGLLRRRGYAVESIALEDVGADPEVRRMTVVFEAGEVERAVKQLERLIDVIEVVDVVSVAMNGSR